MWKNCESLKSYWAIFENVKRKKIKGFNFVCVCVFAGKKKTKK